MTILKGNINMGEAFRTASTGKTATPSTPTVAGPKTVADKSEGAIEVPYTDYRQTHHKPYIADYFELGELWSDHDGGFKTEISGIEDYISHVINSEKLENSTKSVKEALKSIEKRANIKPTDTTSVRIEKVHAFTKFLLDTEHL